MCITWHEQVIPLMFKTRWLLTGRNCVIYDCCATIYSGTLFWWGLFTTLSLFTLIISWLIECRTKLCFNYLKNINLPKAYWYPILCNLCTKYRALRKLMSSSRDSIYTVERHKKCFFWRDRGALITCIISRVGTIVNYN